MPLKQFFRGIARERRGLAIFLFVFGIYVLTLNGVWATDHASAFQELDASILLNHSFAIRYPISQIDIFSWNHDGFRIAGAPGTVLFGLPLVAIGFYFTSMSMLTLTESFVALCAAIGVFTFFKIAQFYFQKRTATFLAFSLAFATLVWPYSSYDFQSDVSLMFLLVALYFALKITRSNEPLLKDFIFCGLAVGSALLTDYIDMILIPLLSAFFFLSGTPRLRRAAAFVSGSFVGLEVLAFYNLAAFGDPFVTSEGLFQTVNNHATKPILSLFTTPIWQGIFVNLASPSRSVFFYDPILIFGVLGIYNLFKTNRTETLLMIAIFLGIFLPYSMWKDVSGGLALGPRFLIPIIPLLLLPAGKIIESIRYETYFLYFYGAILNGSAALVGLIHQNTMWYSPFFFLLTSSLGPTQFNGIDTWWYGAAAQPFITILIFGAALSAPFVPILMEKLRKINSKQQEELIARKIVLS